MLKYQCKHTWVQEHNGKIQKIDKTTEWQQYSLLQKHSLEKNQKAVQIFSWSTYGCG